MRWEMIDWKVNDWTDLVSPASPRARTGYQVPASELRVGMRFSAYEFGHRFIVLGRTEYPKIIAKRVCDGAIVLVDHWCWVWRKNVFVEQKS